MKKHPGKLGFQILLSKLKANHLTIAVYAGLFLQALSFLKLLSISHKLDALIDWLPGAGQLMLALLLGGLQDISQGVGELLKLIHLAGS
jgi:hypothetical protein